MRRSVARGICNREQAVATLPEAGRSNPQFRPEEAEVRNVQACAAISERRQVFGPEIGAPRTPCAPGGVYDFAKQFVEVRADASCRLPRCTTIRLMISFSVEC